ncbi:MAG TPA: GlsB/YeaQ/YmgE family stress response membrane protein [Candidatus Limnocylindrales bacterium]
MLDMGLIGWIVVGFIAGGLSGAVIGDRTARGCLPNIVVGIIGGIVGGWIAVQMGFGQTNGFIAAVIVAFVGAIVVRLVLRALDGGSNRW